MEKQQFSKQWSETTLKYDASRYKHWKNRDNIYCKKE